MTDDSAGAWPAFRSDRARYPKGAWLTERSLWAIAIYLAGLRALGAFGAEDLRTLRSLLTTRA